MAAALWKPNGCAFDYGTGEGGAIWLRIWLDRTGCAAKIGLIFYSGHVYGPSPDRDRAHSSIPGLKIERIHALEMYI